MRLTGHDLSRERPSVRDAAVEEYVADPDGQPADQVGIELDVEVYVVAEPLGQARREPGQLSVGERARRCVRGRRVVRAGPPRAARSPRAHGRSCDRAGCRASSRTSTRVASCTRSSSSASSSSTLRSAGSEGSVERAAQRRLPVEDAAEPEQLVLDLVEGVGVLGPGKQGLGGQLVGGVDQVGRPAPGGADDLLDDLRGGVRERGRTRARPPPAAPAGHPAPRGH